MSIDLRRFKQAFLDESREGLDAMERGLLRLEQGQADAETIHTVFRAAHSIKGGAGTFGFDEIAGLTHLLETLLDRMRSGARAVTPAATTVLLQSADLVRGMLNAAQGGTSIGADRVAAVTAELQRMLDGTCAAPAGPPGGRAASSAADTAGWSIRFAPQEGLFRTGNDPLRVLGALAALGTLELEADLSRLPSFAGLEPDTAYLAWTCRLTTTADRAAIADVFAWVEGDCALLIEPLAATASAPPAKPRVPDRLEDGATGSGGKEPGAAGSSIRVNVEKADALINLVGELVITQAMLKQCAGALDATRYEKLLSGLAQLERNTRDLQDAVMSVRMLPMDFVFSRFPRVVRDLAAKFGKRVRLGTQGAATELDKGVIEKIVDPLTHIVRNALDHGLETPAERSAAGKDETGTVTLAASHQGGHIVIEVSDDGRGLNREKILGSARACGVDAPDTLPDAAVWQLIFAPGLSTAVQVTDVSGRGVGMDVVRKNILSLGGQVDVRSRAGHGMTVTIRLPLTLAILDGMSVAVGDEIFVIPLASVMESMQPRPDDLKSISAQGHLLRVRGEYLPLFSLRELFGARSGAPEHAGIAVLLEADGRKVAVWVDELVGQQQVVIKSLAANYRRVPGISGATIMGDGRVALIVDVAGLTRLAMVAKAA